MSAILLTDYTLFALPEPVLGHDAQVEQIDPAVMIHVGVVIPAGDLGGPVGGTAR